MKSIKNKNGNRKGEDLSHLVLVLESRENEGTKDRQLHQPHKKLQRKSSQVRRCSFIIYTQN